MIIVGVVNKERPIDFNEHVFSKSQISIFFPVGISYIIVLCLLKTHTIGAKSLFTDIDGSAVTVVP